MRNRVVGGRIAEAGGRPEDGAGPSAVELLRWHAKRVADGESVQGPSARSVEISLVMSPLTSVPPTSSEKWDRQGAPKSTKPKLGGSADSGAVIY